MGPLHGLSCRWRLVSSFLDAGDSNIGGSRQREAKPWQGKLGESELVGQTTSDIGHRTVLSHTGKQLHWNDDSRAGPTCNQQSTSGPSYSVTILSTSAPLRRTLLHHDDHDHEHEK